MDTCLLAQPHNAMLMSCLWYTNTMYPPNQEDVEQEDTEAEEFSHEMAGSTSTESDKCTNESANIPQIPEVLLLSACLSN